MKTATKQKCVVQHFAFITMTILFHVVSIEAIAQTDPAFIICGEEEAELPLNSFIRTFSDIDDGDEVRSIAVLIKFQDDDIDFSNRGWPAYPDPTQMPPFAEALLAPDAASITSSDSSLSRYFYDQSRTSPTGPAQFLLYGDVLPADTAGNPIVYVTQQNNEWYHNTLGTPNRRGYGYLTR